MEEVIIARLNPANLKQEVYIMSSNSEQVPLVKSCLVDELPFVIAMAAAKYDIHYIKLAGTKTYAEGIKEQIKTKISTCFGINNDFVIELI